MKKYLPLHSFFAVFVALFLCFLTACAGKLTSKFDSKLFSESEHVFLIYLSMSSLIFGTERR